MKYFVIAILCLSAVSAQYHGSTGRSSGSNGRHQQSSSISMPGGYQSSRGGMSGGYQSSSGGMSRGLHRSGRSLVSQGYSGLGAGHVSAGPAIVSSGSYGHSGHRMGRSAGGDMTSIGPVPVPAVYVNAGHAGHRRGRSVSLLPVDGHSGLGQVTGGYNQGGHYDGHRYARSVVSIAPVAGHASYSGLGLTTGHYASAAGHGHRMARSPVGAYGGAVVGHSSGPYAGGYSNAGHQQGSMGVLHG